MEPEPKQGLPAYLRVGRLALVFAGAIFGVAAREALTFAAPDFAQLPMAVLTANVIGAFLLGLLLEAQAGVSVDSPGSTSLRLLIGTGFLGGFTTYSALALAVISLARADAVALALAYGLGTVIIGGIATWLGVASGAMLGRRHGASVRGDGGALADAGSGSDAESRSDAGRGIEPELRCEPESEPDVRYGGDNG